MKICIRLLRALPSFAVNVIKNEKLLAKIAMEANWDRIAAGTRAIDKISRQSLRKRHP
jgi:hypothetical protein